MLAVASRVAVLGSLGRERAPLGIEESLKYRGRG